MGFRIEAEMLRPATDWLIAEELKVRIEFPMPWGICDLVGVSFHDDNVRARFASGQTHAIGSLLRTQILEQIPDANSTRGITIASLLQKFDFINCQDRVVREMKILQSKNFIRMRSTGSFQKTSKYFPLHTRIVALELKLTRVREALSQAMRNSYFADESYVGLPETVAQRICRSEILSEFKSQGIGILALNRKSADVLLPSRIKKKSKCNVMQLYCADRFWSDYLKDTST